MKTAKTKSGRCNAFPTVWAAIVGCTGARSSRWRYETGSFGRSEVVWFCPVCEAARSELDALRGDALQSRLEELQAAAGVEDYRYARVRRVNGKPVIA